MSSIYQKVLGAEFSKLHPEIRKRFGFDSNDRIASVGKGVMEKVWYGSHFLVPFLHIAARRNLMFPEKGNNIPFLVQNYAYTDKFGRETVSWIRRFTFPGGERRFDGAMIYSSRRGGIVDYLGNHQHLAVDIDVSVTASGGIHFRSGKQRIYEGILGFSFPMLISGYADVREWYDEEHQKFRISVQVRNKFFGKIFGYEGMFETEFLHINSAKDIPEDIFPLREEIRE